MTEHHESFYVFLGKLFGQLLLVFASIGGNVLLISETESYHDKSIPERTLAIVILIVDLIILGSLLATRHFKDGVPLSAFVWFLNPFVLVCAGVLSFFYIFVGVFDSLTACFCCRIPTMHGWTEWAEEEDRSNFIKYVHMWALMFAMPWNGLSFLMIRLFHIPILCISGMGDESMDEFVRFKRAISSDVVLSYFLDDIPSTILSFVFETRDGGSLGFLTIFFFVILVIKFVPMLKSISIFCQGMTSDTPVRKSSFHYNV